MALSLAHVLRSVAARRPTADALVQADRKLSYGELWQTAAAVGGFLRRQELGAGQRVALLLENSPEYVVAYYGVLAAGGVVVGLNSAGKARELLSCLRHCGASWLITHAAQPALPELLAELPPGCRLIVAGEPGGSETISWSEASAGSPLLNLAAPEPDDPAAIIYTSGTTGAPKGVTLSHGNLLSNVQAIVGYLGLDENERVLHALPFHYSYGNSVLHTHLVVGAALVLESGLVYPHRVLERMVAQRVTGFSGVPASFSLLLTRTRLERYDLGSLRYVTQAGGAMAPAAIRRWRELLPRVRFFVMYGQTEATSRLTYLPPERLTEKMGSVGIALPGSRIAILDEAGQPLPIGAAGEICARGPNIMLGYWNDPQATAQALRNGWLRTGDLGRMDRDGFLYIDGRSSDMIKTGAHRVSPQEIEELVQELPGVAEAAAIAMPDELLGHAIKLVVVPVPGQTIDARAVLAHCRGQLAAHKVPRLVEFHTELPKTASGKVKRFQLSHSNN